jgi:predicted MPP superfamily phosphohydrolase
MRLGWLSDIHLNFLDRSAVQAFLRELAAADADVWLLGGDIAQANSVLGSLQSLEGELDRDIYFVLGNHDFYGGSIIEVRGQVRQLVEHAEHLVWLTEAEAQVLNGLVAIVGDDSWADARFGNALRTPVELNDFFLIEELTGLSREALVHTLNGLGDAAAARLAPKLEQAARSCPRVVFLTHVPPFREAAWHQCRPSDDDWVPWFSCRTVGEVILECARAHPAASFLVLCGHTHGSGVYSPAANVIVHTAGAEYGAPRIQRVFEIDARTPAGAWPS